MTLRRFFPAIAALLLMWSGSARAAKNAYVVAGDGSNGNTATLHASPSLSSQSVTTLQVGDPVVISNYPTNGFYKARNSSGQIGWLAESSIGSTPPAPAASAPAENPPTANVPADNSAAPPSAANPPASAQAPSLENVPPAPENTTAVPQDNQTSPPPAASNPLSTMSSPTTSAPPPAQPESAPSATQLPQNESIPYEDVQGTPNGENQPEPTPSQAPAPRVPFEIKVFGGIQSLMDPTAFAQVGATLSSTSPYFGLQVGIPVSERIYALARVEYLSTSTSQANYDFTLSALPLTAGLSYSLLDDSGPESTNIRLRGSVLLGVALATNLSATATQDDAPNTTSFNTQAFTEMLKLDLEIPVNHGIALFAEAGYRFLDSSSVGATGTVNGTSALQATPFSLNLSGFFGGAGLAIYL